MSLLTVARRLSLLSRQSVGNIAPAAFGLLFSKRKSLAAAYPPLRVLNSRSMAWESSAFPAYCYPTWLETCLYNHQDTIFQVVLHFISVQRYDGGPARAAQRRARGARLRLKSCGVESHAFQVCSSHFSLSCGGCHLQAGIALGI